MQTKRLTWTVMDPIHGQDARYIIATDANGRSVVIGAINGGDAETNQRHADLIVASVNRSTALPGDIDLPTNAVEEGGNPWRR